MQGYKLCIKKLNYKEKPRINVCNLDKLASGRGNSNESLFIKLHTKNPNIL